MRTSGSFYLKGELEIDMMNAQLGVLKKDKKYLELKKIIAENTAIIQTDLSFQRNRMNRAKSDRKSQKKKAITLLNDLEFEELTKKLTQESYNNQFFIKELQVYY